MKTKKVATNFDEQANARLVNDFGEGKVKKPKSGVVERLNPTVNIVHGQGYEPYRGATARKEYPVNRGIATGCEVGPPSFDSDPSDVPGPGKKGKK